MSEYTPHPPVSPDAQVIDQLQPAIAALSWHNFLKRLNLGMPRVEARAILLRELRNELANQTLIDGASKLYEPSRLPLLDLDVARSVTELRQYLAGDLNPKRSYIVNNQPVLNQEGVVPDSADNREEHQRLDADCTRLFYEVRALIVNNIHLGNIEDALLSFKSELVLIEAELRKAENSNPEAPNYYRELNKVYRAAVRRLLEIKERVELLVD